MSGDTVLLTWLRKNAMTLKEINSNEELESNAARSQLLMVLPNETLFSKDTYIQHSKRPETI